MGRGEQTTAPGFERVFGRRRGAGRADWLENPPSERMQERLATQLRELERGRFETTLRILSAHHAELEQPLLAELFRASGRAIAEAAFEQHEAKAREMLWPLLRESAPEFDQDEREFLIEHAGALVAREDRLPRVLAWADAEGKRQHIETNASSSARQGLEEGACLVVARRLAAAPEQSIEKICGAGMLAHYREQYGSELPLGQLDWAEAVFHVIGRATPDDDLKLELQFALEHELSRLAEAEQRRRSPRRRSSS